MLVAVLVPTADSRDSRHVCEVWTKQDHPAPKMGFSELTSGPGVEAKAWEETQGHLLARPPDLPLEKSVCRSGSNSYN